MKSSKIFLFIIATALITPQAIFTNDIEDDLEYTQPAPSSSGSWMPYIFCAGLGIVVYRQKKSIDLLSKNRGQAQLLDDTVKREEFHSLEVKVIGAMHNRLDRTEENLQRMDRALRTLWTNIMGETDHETGRVLQPPLEHRVIKAFNTIREEIETDSVAREEALGARLGRATDDVSTINAESLRENAAWTERTTGALSRRLDRHEQRLDATDPATGTAFEMRVVEIIRAIQEDAKQVLVTELTHDTGAPSEEPQG